MVTTSEQEIRNAAMQKARALYITTGVTMNITEAVRLYWKDHPEECARIRARITTREVDRSPTILTNTSGQNAENAALRCSGKGPAGRAKAH